MHITCASLVGSWSPAWHGTKHHQALRKKGRYFFEVELHFGCESPQVGLLSAQFEMAPRTHPKNLTKKRECSLSEFLISSRNHRFKTNCQSRKKLCVFFIDPTFGGPKGCISWVWEMINMAGELMVNIPSCGMEVGIIGIGGDPMMHWWYGWWIKSCIS